MLTEGCGVNHHSRARIPLFLQGIEGSSKGKTWDFGSQNRGSIPLPSTTGPRSIKG